MKIVCAEDCGNAPKKRILKDFHIALAKRDFSFIEEQLSDAVVWNVIGDQVYQGKEAVLNELKQNSLADITELHIHNIITHGWIASANGTVYVEQGKRCEFCYVYRFSSAGKNAKLKEVTVYIIQVDV